MVALILKVLVTAALAGGGVIGWLVVLRWHATELDRWAPAPLVGCGLLLWAVLGVGAVSVWRPTLQHLILYVSSLWCLLALLHTAVVCLVTRREAATRAHSSSPVVVRPPSQEDYEYRAAGYLKDLAAGRALSENEWLAACGCFARAGAEPALPYLLPLLSYPRRRLRVAAAEVLIQQAANHPAWLADVAQTVRATVEQPHVDRRRHEDRHTDQSDPNYGPHVDQQGKETHEDHDPRDWEHIDYDYTPHTDHRPLLGNVHTDRTTDESEHTDVGIGLRWPQTPRSADPSGPLEVVCPNPACRNTAQLPAAVVGRQVVCRSCGQRFTVTDAHGDPG